MKLVATKPGTPFLKAEIYADVYTQSASGSMTVHYRLDVYADGLGIDDQLQDSIDAAKRAAFEDYDIPLDAWHHHNGDT